MGRTANVQLLLTALTLPYVLIAALQCQRHRVTFPASADLGLALWQYAVATRPTS